MGGKESKCLRLLKIPKFRVPEKARREILGLSQHLGRAFAKRIQVDKDSLGMTIFNDMGTGSNSGVRHFGEFIGGN